MLHDAKKKKKSRLGASAHVFFPLVRKSRGASKTYVSNHDEPLKDDRAGFRGFGHRDDLGDDPVNHICITNAKKIIMD
jgi:hypothetical protein